MLSVVLAGVEGSLQSALERVLGKPKEVVSVDISAKLTEAGLSSFFPVECWPPTAAARPSVALATCSEQRVFAGS